MSASVLDASAAKSGFVVVDPAVSAAASESVVVAAAAASVLADSAVALASVLAASAVAAASSLAAVAAGLVVAALPAVEPGLASSASLAVSAPPTRRLRIYSPMPRISSPVPI